MYKYLFLICIGIIIFILLNHIDTFNISSQFNVDFSMIQSNKVVNCPAGLTSCRDRLNAQGGSCALIGLLQLINILGLHFHTETYGYIQSLLEPPVYDRNIVDILLHLQLNENMHRILVLNGLNSNVDVVVVNEHDDTDLLSKVEGNKVYLVALDVNFDKEYLLKNGINSDNFGHLFLVYRKKIMTFDGLIDLFYIIDGCTENVIELPCNSTNPEYNLYDDIINIFCELFIENFSQLEDSLIIISSLFRIFKYRRSRNECSSTRV
tara:strand:+ start:363 stop:1157 length:795 start_codon:yes stop_codon:yes gene_type:complete